MSESKPRLHQDPQSAARDRFEINNRLDRAHKEKRNKLLDLKFERKAMELAYERDQLIEKKLAERRLSLLVIEMRQKLLALPRRIARRFKAGRWHSGSRNRCGSHRSRIRDLGGLSATA